MYERGDPLVRELGQVRLRLRSDLSFVPQSDRGQVPFYLIEDPLKTRFFRLGLAEYTFVSLLDGQLTIHEASRHLAAILPDHELTEVDVAGLCAWLIEMDLAHTTGSTQSGRLVQQAQQLQRMRRSPKNLLVFQLSCGYPDRWFSRLHARLGGFFSLPASCLGAALILLGLYHGITDWERFQEAMQGIFALRNWPWLACCWVILKVLHELAHGMVCKRYGGTVRDAGILFVLFAPLTYVDVTSSWRFRSRWQRMHVAAAGIYVELWVAALAAIVGHHTSNAELRHACGNLIVMASLTTLMFNLNPLMKFDGYYLLSDALGLPNLYTNAQQYLLYGMRRYLLGVPARLPAWQAGSANFTRMYAVLALGWRVVVAVSLLLTAATMFQGLLLIPLAWMLALGWGTQLFSFLKYLVRGRAGEQPRRGRFVMLAGSTAVSLAGLLTVAPWPGQCVAPAIVEYAPHTVVRAGGAGFVRALHVVEGQLVTRGQVLCELENPELARQAEDLQWQVRQSELRARHWEQKGDIAAQQAEQEAGRALQVEANEKAAELAQLTVRAPRAGQVVGRRLAALSGTFVEAGDELLLLGDEYRKELRVSFAQEDLPVFSARVGQSFPIDVPGLPLLRGPLSHIVPRAETQPPHPALAATNAGPLAVKPRRTSHLGSEEELELVAPRFRGIIPLTPAVSQQLLAGQRAQVTCRPCEATIGEYLYRSFSHWLKAQLAEREVE